MLRRSVLLSRKLGRWLLLSFKFHNHGDVVAGFCPVAGVGKGFVAFEFVFQGGSDPNMVKTAAAV